LCGDEEDKIYKKIFHAHGWPSAEYEKERFMKKLKDAHYTIGIESEDKDKIELGDAVREELEEL
jgi:hypothetical protein